MNNDILYPKDIKSLKTKITTYMNCEQDGLKIIGYNNILIWLDKILDKVDYECGDNEYFRVYEKGNKYALQVWKHDDIVSNIKFNLISNYIDEYSVDETIYIEDDNL